MSTQAKRDRYGDVRWTGHFWKGWDGPRNADNRLYLMEYGIVAEGGGTVEGLAVTNGPCDGQGWDVVVYGETLAHEHYKGDAQRIAVELLDAAEKLADAGTRARQETEIGELLAYHSGWNA